MLKGDRAPAQYSSVNPGRNSNMLNPEYRRGALGMGMYLILADVMLLIQGYTSRELEG